MCDTGEVRRYSVREIANGRNLSIKFVRATDHNAEMAAERKRSDKRVEEREQGYAMEYEAFRRAHDEIVDGKDEQITTLKKALDAVLESEEISDEAADALEGENVKLRVRVVELDDAVREALDETEAAGDPWVRLGLIEEILTRAMKATERER